MTPSASSQDEAHSARPFLLFRFVFSLAVLAGAKFLLFPSGLAERIDFRQLYAAGYQARTDPASFYDYEQQKAVQDRLVGKAGGLAALHSPGLRSAAVSAALLSAVSRGVPRLSRAELALAAG